MRFLSTLSLFALVAFSPLHARAELLTNNLVIEPGFGPDVDWLLRQVRQPGDGYGLFAVGIGETSPGTYHFSYQGIAELYSVHTGIHGVAFTPAYALTDPPLLNNGGNPGSFDRSLAVGQSLLLAYWDDVLHDGGTPDEGDAFGWFRLTRTASGLQLAESATVFGSGIYVGTYQAVPEPSAFALFALGTASLFALRRRNSMR